MNNYPEYVEVDNKKYKINTDFRVAIECDKVAKDETIGDFERALAIIYLLFGEEGLNNSNHYEKLLKLAQKYLCCGEEKQNANEEPDMDYIEDYGYIWASFLSDYNGLDIDKVNMHWWKFFDLLNGLSNSELGNCCVLNKIRNLRNFDVSEIKDSKERHKIIKAKEKYALKNNKKGKEIKLTEEQQQSVDEFYKSLGF